MAVADLRDWRGGLNIVDLENALPLNQTYDCLNATVDELGQLAKRGGCANLITISGAGVATYVFYSASLDKYFVQQGATLKKYSNAFVFEANVKTFTTSDKIAMVDFNSTSGAKVVAVHKVDGVWDSPDGVTFTQRSSTVKGTTIAVWQNKLWVGGDTSNLARVWWSNAGTSATWTTATDFVDVREKDVTVITALHETHGGLLVFKEDSAYRINNDQTGAYVMIDRAHGASEHESVASVEGLVGCGNQRGFYTTDGVSELVERSHNVASFFHYAVNANIVVSILRDRFIVGTRAAINVLEWDPRQGLSEEGGGWWPHQPDDSGGAGTGGQGMHSCAGQRGDRLIVLYDDGSNERRVYSFGDRSLGGDFTTSMRWDYVIPWAELNAGDKFNVRRMLIEGRCASHTLSVYVRRDFDATEVDAVRTANLSLSAVGGNATKVVTSDELRGLHWARAIGMRLYSLNGSNFQRIVDNVTTYLPPVAIARIRLDYIPVRRA